MKLELNSTLLTWTATIVRNWRRILNQLNRDTCRLKCSDSTFSSRTRPLDSNFQLLDTILRSFFSRLLCSHLTSKRSALSRPLESASAPTCPAKRIALAIGNGDVRVVERRLDERDPVGYVPTDSTTLVSVRCVIISTSSFRHDLYCLQ